MIIKTLETEIRLRIVMQMAQKRFSIMRATIFINDQHQQCLGRMARVKTFHKREGSKPIKPLQLTAWMRLTAGLMLRRCATYCLN